jgi:hypothetical protein
MKHLLMTQVNASEYLATDGRLLMVCGSISTSTGMT